MNKTISIGLLALTITASCNKPYIKQSKEDLRIQIETVQTKSIIESQKLPSGSEIGLFLAENDKSTYDGLTYANVRFTASGDGSSQIWNPETSVCLSGTSGTVNAYFPYSSTVTDITKIPVETASQTDYMWATPKSQVQNTNATVPLTMNHALTAIRISIKKGTYTGTGNVTKFRIESDGLATTADLNAQTGTLSDFGGTGDDIDSYSSQFIVENTETERTVLAIPNGQSKAISLHLVIDGQNFLATTAEIAPKAGTITTYSLTLNSTEMTIDGISVNPWTETDKGEVELEPVS